MKKILELIKQTFKEWSADRAPRLAAALAYYTVFSLGPFLFLVITLVGLLYGRGAVESRVLTEIQGLIGVEGRRFIEELIRAAGQRENGLLAASLGIATLLFGALGMFGELQNSLNTIWNIKLKPVKGLVGTAKNLLFRRAISFTMVLSTGFILLVSMVLTAAIVSLQEYLSQWIPGAETVLQVANLLIPFLVITLLFAAIFKYLPDAKTSWKDVLIGGAITSFLFTVGKILIGLYLGNSRASSAFGAAGALVLILLWVYYTSQILFLGAEFTQVYANTYGSGIQPDSTAELLTHEERASQGLDQKDTPVAVYPEKTEETA